MSKPENQRAFYAALYDWAGIQIFNLVRQEFHPDLTEVLDVGAGWSKYRLLLPDYMKMDACEIWPKYRRELKKTYRNVFIDDICNLEITHYDVIIMGDVLEHIEGEKAKQLIEYLYPRCKQIFVVVPFQYHQDGDDNPYEEHLQDDLTPELMKTEYPLLDLIAENGVKGLYIKSE